MAIHASKFSSKTTPPKQAGPNLKLPSFKWGRVVLAFGVLAGVILAGRISWELVAGLSGLPGESGYPQSTNYSDRVNVLLFETSGQDVTALSVASIGNDRVELINLDPDWVTNAPQGRGSYRLGSLMKLGDLESGGGTDLLRDSVSRLLAMPIDGYLAATPDGVSWIEHHYGLDPVNAGEKIAGSNWQILLTSSNPPGVYSSFNRLSLLRIGSLIGPSTPFEVPAMGGYFSQTFDSAAFDNDVGNRITESEISRNRPRVSIINASGVAGAATEIARYVHNLGGEVDVVDSSNSPQVKTTIVDHVGTPLATRLAGLLRVKVSRNSTQARTDVEITLGQDIALFF